MTCMACGKDLEFDCGPESGILDGLLFHTSGHYGTTVFDPVAGAMGTLQIVICDECMKMNMDRVRHVDIVTTKKHLFHKVKWDDDHGLVVLS